MLLTFRSTVVELFGSGTIRLLSISGGNPEISRRSLANGGAIRGSDAPVELVVTEPAEPVFAGIPPTVVVVVVTTVVLYDGLFLHALKSVAGIVTLVAAASDINS